MTRLDISLLQPRGCPAARIATLHKTKMRLHLVREHYRQVAAGLNACECQARSVSGLSDSTQAADVRKRS